MLTFNISKFNWTEEFYKNYGRIKNDFLNGMLIKAINRNGWEGYL